MEDGSTDTIEQRVKRAAADAYFFDKLFTPYAHSRREKLYPSRSGYAQFVHYTSAEAALKIINGSDFGFATRPAWATIGKSNMGSTHLEMPYLARTITQNFQRPWTCAREAWLTGTLEEAWETLTPYPDDLMVAWPVSTRVNTPKNNDARLIEPA
jgi:hypothetical protein